MSVHKGHVAPMVNWVGYSVTIDREQIVVKIKADFMSKLGQVTEELLSKNFIKVRDLRTYTGKSTRASNRLITWRPFLDSLWAAVANTLPHTTACDEDPQ